MMAPDLAAFYRMTSDERLRAIRRNEIDLATLQSWFGADAAAAYETLARRRSEHLAGGPVNLVFVPGVMGSLLYSDGLTGVWWVDVRTRAHIDDLRLNPDGMSDIDDDYAIRPFGIDPAYEPFFAAVLERDDFRHAAFPYDWRKPIAVAAKALRERIDTIFETNGKVRIHLVAHSMGGLVVRRMLMDHGDDALWKKIQRIVFIGTPHYGSPSIASYLAHHLWGMEWLALLGRFLSRATFRSLRGVLSLLVAPAGVYPGSAAKAVVTAGNASFSYAHPCANFDLYTASEWDLGLNDEETRQLQAVLDDVARFHEEMRDAHEALASDRTERMLMIAGVGYRSVFRLERGTNLFGRTTFDKITSRAPGDVHRDGDGRVPVASAELPRVETRYVRGIHGGLTNIPAVYEDVFRWLNGQSLQLPTSAKAALSSHLAADAPAPALDRSSFAHGDDPGYLDDSLPEETIDELAARLDTGAGAGLNLTRIL